MVLRQTGWVLARCPGRRSRSRSLADSTLGQPVRLFAPNPAITPSRDRFGAAARRQGERSGRSCESLREVIDPLRCPDAGRVKTDSVFARCLLHEMHGLGRVGHLDILFLEAPFDLEVDLLHARKVLRKAQSQLRQAARRQQVDTYNRDVPPCARAVSAPTDQMAVGAGVFPEFGNRELPARSSEIVGKPRVGGLHHRYEWQEAA
jgi:hypothetical protein